MERRGLPPRSRFPSSCRPGTPRQGHGRDRARREMMFLRPISPSSLSTSGPGSWPVRVATLAPRIGRMSIAPVAEPARPWDRQARRPQSYVRREPFAEPSLGFGNVGLRARLCLRCIQTSPGFAVVGLLRRGACFSDKPVRTGPASVSKRCPNHETSARRRPAGFARMRLSPTGACARTSPPKARRRRRSRTHPALCSRN